AGLPLLVEAGHEVRGVARGPEKAAWLEGHGIEPVSVDLFDTTSVKDAVAGMDAVMHLATSIPPLKEVARAGAWTTNDRLRTETTCLLVDAALDHGVGAVIAESITFPYADQGTDWIDEQSPWGASAGLTSIDDLETEVARFTAGGGRGIALRFGS